MRTFINMMIYIIMMMFSFGFEVWNAAISDASQASSRFLSLSLTWMSGPTYNQVSDFYLEKSCLIGNRPYFLIKPNQKVRF